MPEYFAPAAGETPEMFALFQQFLSLGPDRSLPKLAQLTGKTLKTLQAVKLMELASNLGRLATGLGTEPAESSSGPIHAFRIAIEAALKRVYGEDATVIDVPPDRKNSSQD